MPVGPRTRGVGACLSVSLASLSAYRPGTRGVGARWWSVSQAGPFSKGARDQVSKGARDQGRCPLVVGQPGWRVKQWGQEPGG